MSSGTLTYTDRDVDGPLKHITDATFHTTNGFSFNTDINLHTGKVIKINNVEILSETTLSSSITSSSLTTIGTLTTLKLAGDLNLDSNDLTNGGTITAGSFVGPLIGNADTATSSTSAALLATTRNIGGIPFNGSADINLPGVNQIGNQDTTGNAATVTNGVYLNTQQTITGATTFSSVIQASSGMNGNASTATKLETVRTIGGLNFDGSANINLPGVNQIGNQDTTGNAATATTAGTVTTAIQPNITSLGNLTGLNINGNFSFPNIDGNNEQVLKTNGSGILSWGDVSSGNGVVGGILSIATEQSTSPSIPANGSGGKLYTKPDGKLYWVSNDVSEVAISDGGGGGSGAGAASLWQEPFGMLENSDFSQTENVCTVKQATYYHGFILKTSGTYNKIKVRTRNIGGSGSVTVNVAIYSSNGNNSSPQPVTKLVDASQTTSTSNDILSIGITPTSLSGDTLYYAAIMWNSASATCGFYGTSSIGLGSDHKMTWKETGTSSFPSTAGGSVTNDSAFWFVVSGTEGAAVKIEIAETTTSGNFYPTIVGSVSGSLQLKSNSSLSYNPNTTTLTVPTINITSSSVSINSSGFTGNLTGNADTSSQIAISSSSNNTSFNLPFVDGTSGNTNLQVNSNINFNPSTGTLSVPKLTVTGDTTIINSTTVTVNDPILQIGENTTNDNLDRGLVMLYNDGSAKKAFMGYDESESKFSMLTNATDTSNTFTGTTATLIANLEGNVTGTLTGNSATTTKLQSVRTIAGVAFDGSADITIAYTNLSGPAPTWNQSTSGNAATATKLAATKNIAGQAFDGSADITIEYTNLSGPAPTWNQSTSGNAATATKLAATKNIAGQAFDGSADITIASTDLSDSSNIVLKTGAQTIDDTKTFSSSIVANGGIVGTLTGNSSSATKLAATKNIAGQAFDGTADITIGYNDLSGAVPTWNQDTSGTATNATNVAISNSSVASPLNISFVDGTSGNVGLKVNSNINFNPNSGTLTVPNLTVTGTTTTIDSTTVIVKDPILQLGENTTNDNLDRGLLLLYNDGSAKKAFMGYDESESKFSMLTNATDSNNTFTGTTATLIANLEGNVTGNADTATTAGNATTAGTVTTAAQPAITTLAGLTSFGTSGTAVTCNDKLGIGTTTPESALQVVGSRQNTPTTAGIHMGLVGDDYGIEIATTDTDKKGYIDFTYPNTDYRARILYDHLDNQMLFSVFKGDDALTIHHGHPYYEPRIGIRTTSPDKTLHIKDTANERMTVKLESTSTGSEAGVGFQLTNDGGNSCYVNFMGTGRSTPNDFVVGNNHGDIGLYATAANNSDPHRQVKIGDTWGEQAKTDLIVAGNVGIGTTSPQANLQIDDDFHIKANNSAWSTSVGKGLYMRYCTNGSQDQAWIQSVDRSASNTKYPLYFEASKFCFQTGNVGIGTTDPDTNLDVDGNIRATQLQITSSKYFKEHNLDAEPDRGTFYLNDGRTNKWKGIDVDTEASFMWYNSTNGSRNGGIYSTRCEQWLIYCNNTSTTATDVSLRCNDTTRLQTTTTGVTVTGNLDMTSYSQGNADKGIRFGGARNYNSGSYNPYITNIHYPSTTSNGNGGLYCSASDIRIRAQGLTWGISTADQPKGAEIYLEGGRSPNAAAHNHGSIIFKVGGADHSNGYEQMRVDGFTGNVCIGASGISPSHKLQVHGNVCVGNPTGNTTGENVVYFGGTHGDNSTAYGLISRRRYTGTEGSEIVMFCGNDSASSTGPDRIRLRAAEICFDTTGSPSNHTSEDIKMRIASNGCIGIGIAPQTSSSSYRLYVNGGILNTTWYRVAGTAGYYMESYGGGWNMQDTTYMRCFNDKVVYTNNKFLGTQFETTSDDRIKFNEVIVESCLESIEQLTLKKYKKLKGGTDKSGNWMPTDEEWETVEHEVDSSGNPKWEWDWEYGFIAQEMRNIPLISEFVQGEETDASGNQTPLFINATNLHNTAIGALKELSLFTKHEITELKAKVNALETENIQLKAALAALTARVTALE